MNTSKFVIMLTSLVVMALLVGAVFLPVVSSSTTRTVTTIEENEEPGWSRYAYTQTDDYLFGISIEDDILNIGSQTLGIQTGELSDMMVLSTDVLTIVIDGDSIVAVSEDGAVDLGTSVNVEKTSSGLTVGDATYTAPLWSYYPSATGKYAYFDHADLFTDGKPISAWGSFAGVYAYSQFTYPDVGLVMDATVTDGVIEGVTWGTAPDTLDIQPFNPGDVIFNPIDLDPIDVDLEPIDLGGGENQIMSADPSFGTRVGDWYYTFSGTTATVVGWSSSITDWSTATIPDTVENEGITHTVTTIGQSAFRNCTNLALTSLPSGVTNIGQNAFEGCTNLALTSLPSGITSIPDYAFSGCSSLALTSLPSGITSISPYAFDSCSSLALTSLPSGMTWINESVFYGCTNLALTSLPSGITHIQNNAFRNCTNLALTSLPSGVTNIGNSAFANCTNLALTSLPSGVTNIGTSAFENCTNLALTSLPSGVTSISATSFKGCTNLALTSLPSGVTSIGSNAFMNCTNLALTSLPSGLTSIGTSAFRGCSGMTSLVIPDTVTSVGDSSFSSCTGLRTLVIGGDSSFLGNVFYGCSCGVVVLGEPTFNQHTFDGSSITEVLNLGTSEITTTTGGLNADEVRTDIEAVGYIAPLSLVHREQVTIESPTTDVINILPLVAGIGLLLIGLAMFITRRV